MLTYLLRRCLLMIPTLLGITVVVFAVMAASPGGISAQGLIEGNLEPEARRALEDYYNQRYGLDAPLIQQYGRWLYNISPLGFPQPDSGAFAHGLIKTPDLGTSFLYGRPVAELITERLPITLLLNVISIPLVYVLAILIGVRAATRRGESFDVTSGTILLALWSIPVMLAGILLIGLFASEQNWHWFPEAGLATREARDMPFLPHWSSGHGLLLFLTLNVVVTGLFCWIARRASAFVRLVFFGALGALAGIAMATTIGQTVTENMQLGLAIAGALMVGLIGASELRLAATAVAIVAAVMLASWLSTQWVDYHFTRGFLLDRLRHLVLPVLCLSFGGLAFLAKLTRSAILENLAADYARTARAKGAPENVVLWRHVFRNSLIPLITVAAALLPGLLAGSVVVESLFSIDGMGKLAVDAVKGRDRELVLSLTLMSGVLTLLGYLLADFCYALADPRVSYE